MSPVKDITPEADFRRSGVFFLGGLRGLQRPRNVCLATCDWLRDVCLEEVERALACELVCVGLVGRTVGIGEGVFGTLVDEYLDLALVLAVGVADSVDLVLADVIVGSAEMDHDGAGGFFGGELDDAARVVADGAGRFDGLVVSPDSGDPADEAAVAEPKHADRVDDSLRVLEGGGDILEGVVGFSLG